MRKIFTTEKQDFIAAVKQFQLGKIKIEDEDPGYDLLSLIEVENYSEKRKTASGETDFAQLLILDILPALFCHYLLANSTSYVDIGAEFKTKKHKDNLMWLLLFLVQTARRHALPWNINSHPPERDQTISNPDILIRPRRLVPCTHYYIDNILFGHIFFF